MAINKHPDDMVLRKSPFAVKESVDRLQDFLVHHGATIYARIDQQAELAKAGLSLKPLEFLLFGNPGAGGPVMQENPLAALALPLKVIVLQDADDEVWIAWYSGEETI